MIAPMRTPGSLVTCLWIASSLALLACGDDTSGIGGGNEGGTAPSGGGGEGAAGGPLGGNGGEGEGGGSGVCPAIETEVPPECGVVTNITQSGDGRTLYSIGGVGFEFAPSMGQSAPEVVTISPQAIGAISVGSVELDGFEGDVEAYASVDAVDDLINAPPTASDGRLFVAIAGRVTIDGAPETGSQFKGRVAGRACDVYFVELSDTFEPIPSGDCLHLAQGTFDASDYEATCDAPVDIANTPSGGACLDWMNIGHDCNPITNEGCAENEICDWNGVFKCYPVTGTEVGLCEPCQTDGGNVCQAGMTCDSDQDDGKCHRYCCTDEDCGSAGECIAYSFAPTGVGVCLTR